MTVHPDLEAEQAYIDHAYDCLDEARARANKLQSMVEVGRGGTEQARFERDVIWDTILHRLTQLHLGDASLCFGRIDQEPSSNGNGAHPNGSVAPVGDTYYIGRIAVSDQNQEPVVVDWRAPVAEPFYRATGREPMGLARRRHFATRGRTLLNIEDELFGERALGLGQAAARDDGISGHGALISALETARSGRLGDIVATIQGEQDEIIRAPLPGVLVVQGGPGTGKTVVALHRAAYLLYTHRFPLEDQGVLVIGPNRLFLAYIEQVLPSLGEAGVELAVLADLIDTVGVRGNDRPAVARIKGDERMVKVIQRAVRDRERGLRTDLRVPAGLQTLVVSAQRTARIVADARRRFRNHNAGRRFVEQQLFEALAAASRVPLGVNDARDRLRRTPEVREALEWMWPVLTPAELLHDLYGARSLLRSAGGRILSEEDVDALHRPRSAAAADVTWSVEDVPLLDEARAHLGPTPRAKRRGEGDEVRTYGHIVVDEAQDLSPMQLRMLSRRSLNGSMTVVGDIAQSTGRLGPRRLERGAAPAARSPAVTPGRAHGRLPHPRTEHGARGPGAGRRGARPGAAAIGARGRSPTGVRRSPAGGAARRRRRGGARRARRGRRRQRGRHLPGLDGRGGVGSAGAGRHRARRGAPAGPRPPGHGRAGGHGEGPRARCHGRRGAGGHRRRGAAGHAGPLRGAHPGHQDPHGRARPSAPVRARGRRRRTVLRRWRARRP